MKSKRQLLREKQKRKEQMTYLVWGGVAVAVVALIGLVLWNNGRARPAVGESVAVMADTSHVAEGTDPGPYNSDPPTSGKHYEQTLEAGFYDQGQVTTQYPAGYIVHNLEHGYVIIWYNCDLVGESDCAQLKTDIKAVQDDDGTKVIAFPWTTTDVPVVMTSWGKLLKMERFDRTTALNFIKSNRNKAPEPNAP